MKVAFEAQIVKIDIRKSATMDKEGKLWIEFLPKDDIVDKLNKLMKVDETVKVEIAEK